MTRELYPTEFYDDVQMLPADIDQSHLNNQSLHVVEGLTKDLAFQLVEASTQPHLLPFCANDPGSRFGDIEKVVAWQQKGRLALPLVRKVGYGAMELAGFGWMGPQTPGEDELQLPGATTTFAIRLYKDALGQGNSAPYMRAILAAHEARYGNDGVWLETWLDNGAAIATYKKMGFKPQGLLLSERLGEKKWRQYMYLGERATTDV